MSKLHKHAAVFEAAMRGQADEWEVYHFLWGKDNWCDAERRLDQIYKTPNEWNSRRKQKTHVVNGFTVPEPLREAPPKNSMYYIEEPADSEFCRGYEWDSDFDARCMRRGIAHATKEGAIANCKARLGIDPYKDES